MSTVYGPQRKCIVFDCVRSRIKGHRVCWHCKRAHRAKDLVISCAGQGCNNPSRAGRRYCHSCFNRNLTGQDSYIEIPCKHDGCSRLAAPGRKECLTCKLKRHYSVHRVRLLADGKARRARRIGAQLHAQKQRVT